MLSTKNLQAQDYKDVPVTFIFEYYCNLVQKLSGQSVKIRSLFNSEDHTPSMVIYVDEKKGIYRYKDFSTGKSGTAIDLVMELKGLSFSDAAYTIIVDYNRFISNNSYEQKTIRSHSRYRVTGHKVRQWNKDDEDFWTDYYIGTSFLDEYHIKPLSEYTLSKNDDNQISELLVRGERLYGYFTKDGELYKIYQPKNRDKKFIKVASYIQGSEQLKGYNILIIQSGMKDIGAMKSLNLRVDHVAPDSENTMLPGTVIEEFKKRYKYVFVMFDNDEAGIKAMKKYRDEYGLACILLTDGKDIADAVRDKGPDKIRLKVVSLIELKTFKK